MTNTTDPVDTDALRRLAYDVEHGWDTETGPSLRAAADELDRLRGLFTAEDAFSRARIGRADDARDRLRAVIENAPHAEWCASSPDLRIPSDPMGKCDCWKADVL